MAFDRPRFQPLSFEMANPFLSGIEKGSNIVGDVIDSYYANKEKKKLIEQRELANSLMREEQPFARGMAEQKLKQSTLANQISEQELADKPQMNAADLAYKMAQAKKAETESNAPFGGQNLTGEAQRALGLELLKQQYGEDSEVYKNAKGLMEQEKENSKILNDQRKALTSTTDKRVSTPLAKLHQERDEILQGYMPGSNGTIELTPEQQKEMMGQWNLKIEKESTDANVRLKTKFAENIHKTLDSFDPADLVQYSGLWGKAKEKIDQGKSIFGAENKAYTKFNEAITSAELLAKQIRQFYGDSIQPAMLERIEHLVNPSGWSKNPKIALAQYKQLRSVLTSELATFEDATKDTNKGSTQSDPLGLR